MRAALLVLLLGCGGASSITPPERPVNSQRLELVEGTPTALADGTVLTVQGIGYAHLPDAKNLSTCTVIVARGTERAEVPLAREHGGPDPESSGDALGWELTLEVADPYRRPPRAVIVAVPRHAGR